MHLDDEGQKILWTAQVSEKTILRQARISLVICQILDVAHSYF